LATVQLGGREPMRLLVVDDHAATRKLLERNLETPRMV
jgi:hypothetical protein